MQISRHWRMNAQRYRLEGVRYGDDTVSLQGRPVSASDERQAEPERKADHDGVEAPQLQKIAS